ncbi:transposase [Streptomyces sp. NBC_01788]|nr:transposase [Streptomyces sp. NBC_01788]
MITAWKQDRVARSATGDPGACDLREVVNAIFYQNRAGCQWRYLPHDFPAWSAVFYYFGLWREDGPEDHDGTGRQQEVVGPQAGTGRRGGCQSVDCPGARPSRTPLRRLR